MNPSAKAHLPPPQSVEVVALARPQSGLREGLDPFAAGREFLIRSQQIGATVGK